MIRVAIAASSAITRAGLLSMMPAEVMEIAGVSVDAGSLAAIIEEQNPDVALVAMDPREFEAADWRRLATTPLVVLVPDPQPAFLVEALQTGVRAVLPSGSNPEELVAAVQAAAAGLSVMHPQDLQMLLTAANIQETRRDEVMTEALTSREMEILRLLALGLSNKEIAARRSISEHTVKFHIASIMSKLDAGTRTEAVTLALRQGLIPL